MQACAVIRRLFVRGAFWMLALAPWVLQMGPVHAQTYPSRPMRMIIPLSPGGAADVIARTISDSMSKELGQPILIINRDGAGTIIGLNEAAHATADGYTLLLSGDAGVINTASGRKLPYDLLRDLAPVSLVFSGWQVLLGNKGRFTSLQDMVSYAKANPGMLKFGTAGIGSQGQISSEIFNQAAGIKATHVPYKGVAPAMNDLAGGHVDYVIGGSTVAIPALKAGQFRGLAIMSKARAPQLPDLPTAMEQGINAETGATYGLYMRADVNSEEVRKVHAALTKTLNAPETVERFRSLGGEPRPQSPQEFVAMLRSDVQKLSALMRQLNIKFDD